MKYLFLIASIFIIFNAITMYLAKKYDDPFYIDIFFGLPGAGKSTDICKYGIKVNNGKTPYKKVYCNMNDVAGTYYFDLKELIEINKNRNDENYIIPFEPNSVVCIDEAGYFINNRDFKNFSKFMQYLVRKVRHHKIYIRFYSQAIDIDLVVRNMARRYYIMKKYFNVITLIKPISKDMGIGLDVQGNGRLCETYQYLSIFSYQFNWIPRYIGLFNSHEVKTKEFIDNSIYNDYTYKVKYSKSLILYILHCFKIEPILKFNISFKDYLKLNYHVFE